MAILKGTFILILLFLMVLPSKADIFQASHTCTKPYKPFQFETELDFENFMYEVKNYKACIQDFVDEQEGQIKKHQNAIDEATEDWNSFVRYELN